MRDLFILTFFTIGIVTSCKTEDKPSEVLNAAYEEHLQALEIKTQVDSILINEISSIEIDSLKELVTQWKKSLIEVPGFPHHHEEGEEHVHNHVGENMSEAEILKYQQLSREAITEIKDNLEKVIAQ